MLMEFSFSGQFLIFLLWTEGRSHERVVEEIVATSVFGLRDLPRVFFINILSLASPIFVIQVLNRYVGYGFDGTLITLTVGMLIAGVLNHAFTVVRVRLASAVNVGPDRMLSETVLGCLARAKMSTLGRIPPARIHELMSGIQVVQSGYDASVILLCFGHAFLDPFCWGYFFSQSGVGSDHYSGDSMFHACGMAEYSSRQTDERCHA